MVDENTLYFPNDKGEKEIYNGSWAKLQKEAKLELPSVILK